MNSYCLDISRGFDNRQERYSGNARKNSDGTYNGNSAWGANQCVLTGTDCYVGDFCCGSGDTCPSCTVAPCQCLPVNGEKSNKKNSNRSGNKKNRQSGKSESQCVATGSAITLLVTYADQRTAVKLVRRVM